MDCPGIFVMPLWPNQQFAWCRSQTCREGGLLSLPCYSPICPSHPPIQSFGCASCGPSQWSAHVCWWCFAFGYSLGQWKFPGLFVPLIGGGTGNRHGWCHMLSGFVEGQAVDLLPCGYQSLVPLPHLLIRVLLLLVQGASWIPIWGWTTFAANLDDSQRFVRVSFDL